MWKKMKFLQNTASRHRRSRPLSAHYYYNIKYNNNITHHRRRKRPLVIWVGRGSTLKRSSNFVSIKNYVTRALFEAGIAIII